MPITRRIETNF